MTIDISIEQTNQLVSVSAPTSTIDVALTGDESVSVAITSAPILVDVSSSDLVDVSISSVGATGPEGPQGPTGAAGQGVPTGGSAGQVLSKIDGTNYNTQWINQSSGSGTVTSVSVVTANGVSGSVANATTTPAITLSLGAITPTTIVASGTISGSNLSGANTGDNAVNSLYSGLVSNATHTGDVTGATALTLATVNSNVGSFGSATQTGTFTVNGKGLITAASNTTISVTSSAVSDFAEAAQDAVGTILVDSTEIDFTYNDATPSIAAAIVAGSIDETKLDTSVNASLDLADSAAQFSFRTIAVSGQSDVVADTNSDTLTLVAGTNVTITTNAGTDTVTIAASGGGGGSVISGVGAITVPNNAFEHSETIVAVGITLFSQVMVGLAPMLDSDENDPEMVDLITLSGQAGTDLIDIKIAFSEPTAGQINIVYMGV